MSLYDYLSRALDMPLVGNPLQQPPKLYATPEDLTAKAVPTAKRKPGQAPNTKNPALAKQLAAIDASVAQEQAILEQNQLSGFLPGLGRLFGGWYGLLGTPTETREGLAGGFSQLPAAAADVGGQIVDGTRDALNSAGQALNDNVFTPYVHPGSFFGQMLGEVSEGPAQIMANALRPYIGDPAGNVAPTPTTPSTTNTRTLQPQPGYDPSTGVPWAMPTGMVNNTTTNQPIPVNNTPGQGGPGDLVKGMRELQIGGRVRQAPDMMSSLGSRMSAWRQEQNNALGAINRDPRYMGHGADGTYQLNGSGPQGVQLNRQLNQLVNGAKMTNGASVTAPQKGNNKQLQDQYAFLRAMGAI